MVVKTGHSTRLWFDLRHSRHRNLFKITRADFGCNSGLPSHVKVVSWWLCVTAYGWAAQVVTTDDEDVAMTPLRHSKFSTWIIKDCK